MLLIMWQENERGASVCFQTPYLVFRAITTKFEATPVVCLVSEHCQLFSFFIFLFYFFCQKNNWMSHMLCDMRYGKIFVWMLKGLFI